MLTVPVFAFPDVTGDYKMKASQKTKGNPAEAHADQTFPGAKEATGLSAAKKQYTGKKHNHAKRQQKGIYRCGFLIAQADH